jgi:acetyl-CoA acetyltransferase
VGCGYTEVTRRPKKTEFDLAIQACRDAVEDAGIDPAEIDGVNLQSHHGVVPDFRAIAQGIGLGDISWSEEGSLGVFALSRAAQAIDAGLCKAAIVCKIMDTTAPVMPPSIDPDTGAAGGPWQFEAPYGLGYTMQRIGFTVRRWMHKYGITDHQVGWLTVVQREHAMLNPHAAFREPLTIQDYLESRWIAEPVRLFDCDYPVNGAFAYVVTTADRAAHLRHRPVILTAWADSGFGFGELSQHYLQPELVEWPTPLAQRLYRDAHLSPADMDLWMLYDGFSFFALQWMENLGLVARGESGSYVEGGSRIRYTAEHPVNTNGGQLSEGRLHGAGSILESVQQLRGTAGERQVKSANHAVVTTSYPNIGAAAILSRG